MEEKRGCLDYTRCACYVGAAFLVVVACGIDGVLYDLDHVLALWIRGLPITWENLLLHSSRMLHIPGLLVRCVAFFVSCALLAGRAPGPNIEMSE